MIDLFGEHDLKLILHKLEHIMADLTALNAAVAANTTAVNAAVAEIATLNSSTQQSAIDALTATLTTNNQALTNAVPPVTPVSS